MLNLKTYLRFFLLISIFIYPFKLHAKELTLTKNEANSLKQFFHALLWGSQVGYVLYGQKPICFEGCSKDIFNGIFTKGHHLTVSINEGLEVWNKLQIGFDFPNFMIINQNITNNYSLVLFINKDALKHVFNEHSSLFRYRLGADLSADKLLDLLKYKDLFTVLNNDAVLIGLLLGFGFENSLHIGRLENIYDDLYFYKSVNKNFSDLFLFKFKQILPALQKHSLKPSFNYSSLQQELEDLSNKTEYASPSLEFYSPQLIFGKVANCLENDERIEHYENVQLKIIEILDQENWLEQIFSQFFGEPIKLTIEEHLKESRLGQNLEWSKIMAEIFFSKFMTEFEGAIDTKFQEFLAGMKEADLREDAHYLAPFPIDLNEAYPSKEKEFLLGFKIWSFYKFNPNLFSLKNILQELKDHRTNEIDLSAFHAPIMQMQWDTFHNIDQHEHSLALSYFQKFDNLNFSGVKCIAPNRLYYQEIHQGEGAAIKEDQILKVSYTLKTACGHILEEEENRAIDLRRAIKGFRKSFPTLRIGEKGILYIHPEWGIKKYLSPPYYSPYLLAEFKILSRFNNRSSQHSSQSKTGQRYGLGLLLAIRRPVWLRKEL